MVLVSSLVVAGSFVWTEIQRLRGRHAAESDWHSGAAGIILETMERHVDIGGKSYVVWNRFDQDSGLPIIKNSVRRPLSREFISGYNARVRELQAEFDTMDWPPRKMLLNDRQFAALTTNPDFSRVTEFPLKILPNVTLTLDERHGDLTVISPSGRFRCGIGRPRVYTLRLEGIAEFVFVRVEENMVIAIHVDGTIFSILSENVNPFVEFRKQGDRSISWSS